MVITREDSTDLYFTNSGCLHGVAHQGIG